MKPKANIAAMKPYVPGKTIPGAAKLSANENPLGSSPRGVQAIRDMLDGIHRYPDGAAMALKEKLARQWDAAEENFIVANGSGEVLNLLATAWIGEGENAVAARETFSLYRYAVGLFNSEIREVPLEDGLYPLDALLRLADGNTRIIFICNPNNPTGTYRAQDEIDDFLSAVPPEIIVVMDEAYADFADAPDFPDSRVLLKKYPNLVVMRTFSKLYGLAGLRVGYAVGHPDIISGADRASLPFNVNLLAQAAALESLEDEEFRSRSVELVRTEKGFFAGELTKRGIFYYPTQANFICFGIGQDVAELWTPIAERGIAVRDLESFGLPRMIRYTFGLREDNERLLAILDELL